MSLPSSAQLIFFFFLVWFARWEACDRTPAVWFGTAFRINSKQHATSLCISCHVFSPSILLDGWFTGFYGISNLVDYVMLNHVYIYIYI